MDGSASLPSPESVPVESLNFIKEFKSIPEFLAIKPKQRRYLLAYCATGSITGCGKLCGISWILHYRWLQQSEQYKQAYNKARDMFADYAEGDVFNRAFVGTEKTITKTKGKTTIIEKLNHKSDVLAIFALKGLRPEYRDGFNITTIGPAALAISYPSSANRALSPDNSIPSSSSGGISGGTSDIDITDIQDNTKT